MKKAKINKINIVTKAKKSIGVYKWDLFYYFIIGVSIYLGYLDTGLILIGLYAHKRLL